MGIGLFYGQGYFRQRVDSHGWQREEYLRNEVQELPMEAAIGTNGQPVAVKIDTRSGSIAARVWRVRVGRCDLLLLDSNVEGNAPEDRELTSQLYGGDRRVRIRQELLLGVGGFRALRAMGITPGVLHLNEGHSAFAVLEAIRTRMEDEGLSFRAGRAARLARSGLHHAHAGAGGARSLRRGIDRGTPRAAAGSVGPVAVGAHGHGPGEPEQSRTKSFA